MKTTLRRLAGIILIGVPMAAQAAHPLITDDAGTQGKGKFQFEATGEYGRDRETVAGVATKSTAGQMNATFTAGITDTWDVFVDVPHQWNRTEAAEMVRSGESGFSDVSVGAKWRFFEKEGLCFAFKPVVSLPTGDEDKGLGAEKASYSAFFIAAKVMDPAAVFANIGYIRNGNRADEEKNRWHASAAFTYGAARDLNLAANIGMERNADKTADKAPAFGLIAAIYGVNKNLDIDVGVKKGLNSAETDETLLAGVTMRF